MQLSRIQIFPIKSLDGVTLDQSRVTSGGILENDRVYTIVDCDGKVVNGKRTARVHQLRSEFGPGLREVRLAPADGASAQFPLDNLAAISDWLSAFFDLPVTVRHESQKGFPDDREAFGPTIVSEASLAAIQQWYPGLTLDSVRRRFRANLELSGGPAFCEDALFGAAGELKPFQIGPVRFLGHNPCQRCVVPTRDPDAGNPIPDFQEKFMRLRKEHLPAWANAARFNHFYRFAVNTSIPPSEAEKRLRVGDAVALG
jgi:hypothetical protein